jgi:hypothetical protein
LHSFSKANVTWSLLQLYRSILISGPIHSVTKKQDRLRSVSILVQYPSESRTFWLSNGHLSDTFCVQISVGPAFKWSGLDLFVRLSNGIRHFISTSKLDRFIIKKCHKNILFMPKRSRLDLRLFFPAFKWWGIQMPGTGRNRPFESRNGPAFGGVLYILTVLKS